jgi:Ni/Fe-hydrogenase 1 B-type cytochrome subunit
MVTNLTTKESLAGESTFTTGPVSPSVIAFSDAPATYRRVYVWELPVRVFHWINAWGIALLFLTGLLIGNPLNLFQASEPYQQYWFGWVRFAHFATAYVVLFTFLFRVYWGFVGNRYARWSSFFPVTKEQWRDLWGTIRIDILQLKLKGRISIGHNYLASLTYIALFLILLFQVVSGFGLYASMSESFVPKLFTWIVPVMGGDANVRQWHHILSWAFAVFALIHVYLVFYHDYVEGRGDMSSMLGGWKFEKDEELHRKAH